MEQLSRESQCIQTNPLHVSHEIKIGDACKLVQVDKMNISGVCFEC